MKTLFIAPRPDAEALAVIFRAQLPDHRIVTTAPADGPVVYAVVGRPRPGTVCGLRGLELVFSLDAGIEQLLASGEVPASVPIVRMVDPGLVEGMVEWVAAQAYGGSDLAAATTGGERAGQPAAHYADDDRADRFGPGGAAVVDADVLAALDAGTLGWAVLDMFRTEPLPADHPCRRHPRMCVSPHVADARPHRRGGDGEQRSPFDCGEPVPNVVDRTLGYRPRGVKAVPSPRAPARRDPGRNTCRCHRRRMSACQSRRGR